MEYRQQHKTETGTKAIALFFIALMFFAYSVEAFHHHAPSDLNNGNPDTETTLTKQATICVLCEQIVNNLNTGFLCQDLGFTLNPPLPAVVSTVDGYNLHFYKITLQTSKNKGPPAVLKA